MNRKREIDNLANIYKFFFGENFSCHLFKLFWRNLVIDRVKKFFETLAKYIFFFFITSKSAHKYNVVCWAYFFIDFPLIFGHQIEDFLECLFMLLLNIKVINLVHICLSAFAKLLEERGKKKK
jgi:hypothetical protein